MALEQNLQTWYDNLSDEQREQIIENQNQMLAEVKLAMAGVSEAMKQSQSVKPPEPPAYDGPDFGEMLRTIVDASLSADRKADQAIKIAASSKWWMVVIGIVAILVAIVAILT